MKRHLFELDYALIKSQLEQLGGCSINLEMNPKIYSKRLGMFIYATETIVLYHRAHTSYQDLLETAIHELAHYIDFKTNGRRRKPHTGPFKTILTDYRDKAVQLGMLQEDNPKELLAISDAAYELGKAIYTYVELKKYSYTALPLQVLLRGISKKALAHLYRFYIIESELRSQKTKSNP